MITLREWMETTNYRITEGDQFGWQCYGPNAHCLSAWNGIHDKGGYSLAIIFDTETQAVYEVEVCDYTNQRAYRLIDPDFRDAHRKESETHGALANQAWDDVSYIDLETGSDWLEKAQAIVDGETYDTRVSIPLTFKDDELLQMMKLAHERDITFNQFVEEALMATIEEYERDPEGMKLRAQEWKKQNDLT